MRARAATPQSRVAHGSASAVACLSGKFRHACQRGSADSAHRGNFTRSAEAHARATACAPHPAPHAAIRRFAPFRSKEECVAASDPQPTPSRPSRPAPHLRRRRCRPHALAHASGPPSQPSSPSRRCPSSGSDGCHAACNTPADWHPPKPNCYSRRQPGQESELPSPAPRPAPAPLSPVANNSSVLSLAPHRPTAQP